MRKSPIREWSKDGEKYHNEANALLLADVQFQQNTIDYLVNNPPDLRERMQNIEIGELGFMIKDGVILNKQGLQLNSDEENTLRLETDRSMLEIHPELLNNGLRYVNGEIVLKTYQDTIEEAEVRRVPSGDSFGLRLKDKR